MGNLVSSLFGPSQEEICNETEAHLTNLYTQALSSKSIEELQQLYTQALTYNKCKDEDVNKYKGLIHQIYLDLVFNQHINSFKDLIDKCDDKKCVDDWYAVNLNKLDNIAEIKDKYRSTLEQMIINKKIELENKDADELINKLDKQSVENKDAMELLQLYVISINEIEEEINESTDKGVIDKLNQAKNEYKNKIDLIIENSVKNYKEINERSEVKVNAMELNKKSDSGAINDTYNGYYGNIIKKIDELDKMIIILRDYLEIFNYLVEIGFISEKGNKETYKSYISDVEKIIEKIEKENAELFKKKVLLSFKKLIAFIFCGYGVSVLDVTTRDLQDIYTNSIKYIIDNYLSIDTYKIMLQFSELISLVYPFDSQYSFSNLDFVNSEHMKDPNNPEKYLSFSIPKYISSSNVYNKLTLSEIDNSVNSLQLPSEDNLKCHLFYLGVYFSRYYYANKSIKNLLDNKYNSLILDYLTHDTKFSNLYIKTKELLQRQDIEHWKGLALMSKKRLNSNIKFEIVPVNTPIYFSDYEKQLATIYILNCIYFKVGDINQGGQYTYKIESDKIGYKDFFNDEVFFYNSGKNEMATIEEILNYGIDKGEIIERYENIEKMLTETKNKYESFVDGKKQYNEKLIELSSDEFIKNVEEREKAVIKNHTELITDRFFQISETQLIKELGLGKLGCYSMSLNNEYILNISIINELLSEFNSENSLNVMANSVNHWMFSSIDYMCCVGNQNNSNTSELVAFIYQEVIRKVLTWRMVIPIQTLSVNITINNNDYKTLKKNGNKEDWKIHNDMFDRSSIFMKLDKDGKPIDNFGF